MAIDCTENLQILYIISLSSAKKTFTYSREIFIQYIKNEIKLMVLISNK